MKDCAHDWLIEHTVYKGYWIHRQCARCGEHQVAKAKNFRWILPNEEWELPDLRDQTEAER